jgi:hypothetical protein
MNSGLSRIIQACQVLVEAKHALGKPEFKALCEDLKLSPRTKQALLRIGSNPRFQSKRVQKQLPPCWATLETITTLTDKQFEQAIKTKLIRPSVAREEINRFKKGSNSSVKLEVKSDVKQARLITISLDKSMAQPEIAKEILEEIVDKVEDLRQIFRMYNIHTVDHGLVERLESLQGATDEAMKRAFEGIANSQEATLRLLARIAKAIARSRKKFASPSERKNVRKGFMVRGWGMEEVYKCEPTREGIATAFGELDISLDIDQCIANPQLARDYYQKVKAAQDSGIKW